MKRFIVCAALLNGSLANADVTIHENIQNPIEDTEKVFRDLKETGTLVNTLVTSGRGEYVLDAKSKLFSSLASKNPLLVSDLLSLLYTVFRNEFDLISKLQNGRVVVQRWMQFPIKDGGTQLYVQTLSPENKISLDDDIHVHITNQAIPYEQSSQ